MEAIKGGINNLIKVNYFIKNKNTRDNSLYKEAFHSKFIKISKK